MSDESKNEKGRVNGRTVETHRPEPGQRSEDDRAMRSPIHGPRKGPKRDDQRKDDDG